MFKTSKDTKDHQNNEGETGVMTEEEGVERTGPMLPVNEWETISHFVNHDGHLMFGVNMYGVPLKKGRNRVWERGMIWSWMVLRTWWTHISVNSVTISPGLKFCNRRGKKRTKHQEDRGGKGKAQNGKSKQMQT
jgi:hypothetical protein